MPNHSIVSQLTPGDLAAALYGLPFPGSCQDRIKIGTYSIDVTITYSLRLTSSGGRGQYDGSSIAVGLGTVSDSNDFYGARGGIDTILTSGLGPGLWPYYNGAGADLAGTFGIRSLAANCFPSACSGSVRAIGTFNFASLDTVLAVYALTNNCVGLELSGQPFCAEDYGNTYLPGLEGATLRLSATAVLIPLYETSR